MMYAGLALALVLWLLASMPETPQAKPEVVTTSTPILSQSTLEVLLFVGLAVGAIAQYRARAKHNSESEFEE